jgi:pyruvate carboxylase
VRVGETTRIVEQPDELRRTIQAVRRQADGLVTLAAHAPAARIVQVVALLDGTGAVQVLHDRSAAPFAEAPAPNLEPEERAQLARDTERLAAGVGRPGVVVVAFGLDRSRRAWHPVALSAGPPEDRRLTARLCGFDLADAEAQLAAGGRVGSFAGAPAAAHACSVLVSGGPPGRLVIRHAGTVEGVDAEWLPLAGTLSRGQAGGSGNRPLLRLTAATAGRATTLGLLDRALRDLDLRGLPTNVAGLRALLPDPLQEPAEPPVPAPGAGDDAQRLCAYLAQITVHGHPELRGRDGPQPKGMPPAALQRSGSPPPGARALLAQRGPEGFAAWMRAEQRVLVTDTTLRDAHQSLLATRVRTADLLGCAEAYAHDLPQLLSLECWGGATFDVAMRFLHEDPWERLAALRAAIPNIPLQMLLRGSNAVGYTSYPPAVVAFFVEQAAAAGIDIFRVFDSLNIVENMLVAIDAVRASGRLCEGTICYTADIHDQARPKYTLGYYLELAKRLEQAGCHVLAIKDMAGVCRASAAGELVDALRNTVALPVHLHTHDTSGFAPATVYEAVQAGVDAVDAAVDAMSGLTSQVNLGSLVRALEHQERSTGLSPEAINALSGYWEQVRRLYAPFESDIRAGTSDIYRHEMPGGQYTNLREQARGLGLSDAQWPQVAEAYAAANRLLGDIVKVTPSSKVVGDLALAMVSAGVGERELLDPQSEIAFPASVVGLLKGELGVPEGGFPAELTRRVLGEDAVSTAVTPPAPQVDLEALTSNARSWDVASRLMYPQVYDEFAAVRERYGDLSVLPTDAFYRGLAPGEARTVTLSDGASVELACAAINEREADGRCSVLFTIDGEAYTVRVAAPPTVAETRAKADRATAGQVASPMAGVVAAVHVSTGAWVAAGEPLVTLEAMKMEVAVTAPIAGVVDELLVQIDDRVQPSDLLVVLGARDASP